MFLYVNCANFESFGERYSNYIENCAFSIQTRTKLKVLSRPNADARVAKQTLSRDDYDFSVYFIVLKIS